MKEFNQFDMEQQLMDCWGVCDDLETLCEGVLDRNMTTDQISNVLLGMKDLYQLKFEKLMEHFEHMCKELYTLRKSPSTIWPTLESDDQDVTLEIDSGDDNYVWLNDNMGNTDVNSTWTYTTTTSS